MEETQNPGFGAFTMRGFPSSRSFRDRANMTFNTVEDGGRQYTKGEKNLHRERNRRLVSA